MKIKTIIYFDDNESEWVLQETEGDEISNVVDRAIEKLGSFERNYKKIKRSFYEIKNEKMDHDCKRDKYGQDACPVCDGEEGEIPFELEEEEELIPAEESWNEHDLTRKEIEEEESTRGWA
ncbi:MAG: hypothetical protein QXX68_03475 [Candidatus Pacearchaeota archaeon]